MSDSSSFDTTSASPKVAKKQSEADWPIKAQIVLLQAIVDHRPIGVNRHFEMLCLLNIMKEAGYDYSSTDIWNFLKTLYNLKGLEDAEALPSWVTKESDFELPDEYYALMKQKILQDQAKNVRYSEKAVKSDVGDEAATIPDDYPLSLIALKAKRAR